eukprot:10636374-Alexandrium_andersonii.AAC.1
MARLQHQAAVTEAVSASQPPGLPLSLDLAPAGGSTSLPPEAEVVHAAWAGGAQEEAEHVSGSSWNQWSW